MVNLWKTVITIKQSSHLGEGGGKAQEGKGKGRQQSQEREPNKEWESKLIAKNTACLHV